MTTATKDAAAATFQIPGDRLKKRQRQGQSRKSLPITNYPTVSGSPDVRPAVCRPCRDEALRARKTAEAVS
jgi:hypothetical protein